MVQGLAYGTEDGLEVKESEGKGCGVFLQQGRSIRVNTSVSIALAECTHPRRRQNTTVRTRRVHIFSKWRMEKACV